MFFPFSFSFVVVSSYQHIGNSGPGTLESSGITQAEPLDREPGTTKAGQLKRGHYGRGFHKSSQFLFTCPSFEKNYPDLESQGPGSSFYNKPFLPSVHRVCFVISRPVKHLPRIFGIALSLGQSNCLLKERELSAAFVFNSHFRSLVLA